MKNSAKAAPSASQKNKANKGAAITFAVALFFFILSFSIGLPIYCRFFYYPHISAYNLVEVSGFSRQQIITAYNELLTYLTVPGAPYASGELTCSPSAVSHFKDCKFLFLLDSAVILISALVLITIFVLRKKGVITSLTLGKFHASFWAAVAVIVIPVVIGSLAAINFDKAFEIFHAVLFPGKENWIFNWDTDQLIWILPQEFFRNCGIFIGAGILTFSGTIIAVNLLRRKKHNAPKGEGK